MAEEQNKDSVLGGLRSRLPKFASKGAAEEETSDAPVARPAASPANASGRSTSPAKSEAPSNTTPDSTKLEQTSTPQENSAAAPQQNGQAATATTEGAADLTLEEAHLQHLQYLVEEFGQVQSEMQRMYNLVEEIAERESAHEKVFNTLHAELRDYKNDFIYEHLKPVVRPLLFLYDSLEQFDAEIALYERPSNGERRQSGLSPHLVRENISFFRDQLVEALRICEVTPMETPKGAFNPKLHKVIDVVPVDPGQDGMIQRVVRSGWYLNGALLRSAEVIVGKKM